MNKEQAIISSEQDQTKKSWKKRSILTRFTLATLASFGLLSVVPESKTVTEPKNVAIETPDQGTEFWKNEQVAAALQPLVDSFNRGNQEPLFTWLSTNGWQDMPISSTTRISFDFSFVNITQRTEPHSEVSQEESLSHVSGEDSAIPLGGVRFNSGTGFDLSIKDHVMVISDEANVINVLFGGESEILELSLPELQAAMLSNEQGIPHVRVLVTTLTNVE